PERIVVFGLKPLEPATGYGYIEQAERLGSFRGLPAFDVASFREKPPRKAAAKFVASGRFLWNSGIFCFRAATLLEAIGRHLPRLARALKTLGKSVGTRRFAAEL